MATVAAQRLDSQRIRCLTAMGLRPWVLRDAPVQADQPRCVVIVAATLAEARQRQLVECAVACLGLPDGAVMRATARDGRLTAGVPATPAYLAFGSAQAQALGAALTADQRERACIALTDEPAQLLDEPYRKRGLWLALKAVRRATHAVEI